MLPAMDGAAHPPTAPGAAPLEARLLPALRAGEPDAFEQVVRHYGGWLLGVARRTSR